VGKQVLSAFVEVDRGTMPNDRFKRKVEAYFAYDVSGRYTERYKSQRFRVLVITQTPERLTNLKETTAQVAQRNCWFTILAEIGQRGPLAAVWQTIGREAKTRLIEADGNEVHGQAG
jgi:hypothetical protein